MKSNELIEAMKDLIHAYDLVENENSPVARELHMWRDRYLKEKKFHPRHDDKIMFIRNCFFATPSVNFGSDPDKILNEIINSYGNK